MIVYWTKYEGLTKISSPEVLAISTGIRSTQPIPVEFINNDEYKIKDQYKKCPAFTGHLKNLYYIPASMGYDLQFSSDGNVSSKSYNQKFFDEMVQLRDMQSKLCSLRFFMNFVPEVDDLEISMLPAYLHRNSFVDNTLLIPGTFNVGKWPRPLEPAFHVTKDNVSFKEGDALYYVKFHTNEKIIFKEFMLNRTILDYFITLLKSREYKSGFKNLSFYYDLLKRKPKFRKMMMEEIKKNVLE